MDKLSIAVKPFLQALSTADYKGSSENYYNPVKLMADICEKAFLEKEKKREERRITQEEREIAEKEERKKTIKKCFEWGRKKAENLKIAYAILSNDKDKIELIPNLDIKAFLEVADDTFDYKERWLLANLVYEMSESLNNKINLITSGVDANLYYEYYKYDPKLETTTCNYNGEPKVSFGGYVPTAELLEMKTERDLLIDLSSQLNDISTIEPDPEDLEELRQALAVK